jgi:NAD(P)-dependent dehydrogenase (short-subunit alcohol dehydrogenase family)
MGTGARILDGQVAVVTGAGSSGPGFGTGKAISCLLARHGANVVLVDKVEGRARGTETLINDEGGTALVIAADLERPENCQLVVDRAVEGFGGIDILVNNAAVAEWADIVSITLEEYQHTIAVNLAVPHVQGRDSQHACARRWLDREHHVDCRDASYRRSTTCLRCRESWLDRVDDRSGRHLQHAWHTGELHCPGDHQDAHA